MPNYILLGRAKRGEWKVLATLASIREVQLILPTMIGIDEARLLRLDEDRMLDVSTDMHATEG